MRKNLNELPADSRVWMYTANRVLTNQESEEIKSVLEKFSVQWLSHGIPVQSFTDFLHNRFIIIAADESQHGVSGCSTDSSVNLVKSIGQQYGVDFFNRFIFAFQDEEGTVYSSPKEEIEKMYSDGKINDSTLFFDGLIKTKDQFENKWLVPLSESWHKRFI